MPPLRSMHSALCPPPPSSCPAHVPPNHLAMHRAPSRTHTPRSLNLAPGSHLPPPASPLSLALLPTGLNRLSRELRAGDGGLRGAKALAALLQLSPGLPELTAVWDAQATVKHAKITAALLGVLADTLRLLPCTAGGRGGSNPCGMTELPSQLRARGAGVHDAPGERIGEPSTSMAASGAEGRKGKRQRTPGKQQQAQQQQQQAQQQQQQAQQQQEARASFEAVRSLQADLAGALAGSHVRAACHALGSDDRGVANGALDVLAAVAQRGPADASALAATLDFSLPALAVLAAPPRLPRTAHDGNSGGGGGGVADVQRAWREWETGSVAARPSRSLFVDFGESKAALQHDTASGGDEHGAAGAAACVFGGVTVMCGPCIVWLHARGCTQQDGCEGRNEYTCGAL
eukprot:365357-Chlamydomonas_euryale.AAC.16